ncbi:MAG: hypothetical protein KJP25_06975 [Gammaproteobacteria bacterium]|nr:hypothetical protein [Gammaproteobacteria bacterium]MBT8150181.1 hypothetical protein [Gammaproteobacteria bacterium]NNM10926.1 hypothetical protein [Pseudomonadales bacterium]
MQNEKNISLYLERYAEVEAAQVLAIANTQDRVIFNDVTQKAYQFSIGIPVYDETAHFIDGLVSICHKRTLLILVVNQPLGSATNKRNRALLAHLEQDGKLLGSNGHIALYTRSPHCDVMLVDRTSPKLQLPPKQGVGLARKIAADIALALYATKHLYSPWLCSTDADAMLPGSYFSIQATLPDAAACLLPFCHQRFNPGNPTARHRAAASNAYDDAAGVEQNELDYTLLYEKKIRQYVQGLQFAGSPYAYHALGSTLCIHALHYAAVRGFPKRNAGEDFYILNKLRKTGDVVSLAEPTITLEARRSQRTPFGTGPAVANLYAAADPHAAIFYHPGLFLCLRTLLQWQAALANNHSARLANKAAVAGHQPWQPALSRFVLATASPTTQSVTASLANAMAEALCSLGFDAALRHCEAQASSAPQYARHMQNWFDAFRTLRWLHELRTREQWLHNVSETQAKRLWEMMLREELQHCAEDCQA